MLHGPVEGIVRVEVAHALEVERFGPCMLTVMSSRLAAGTLRSCSGAGPHAPHPEDITVLAEVHDAGLLLLELG